MNLRQFPSFLLLCLYHFGSAALQDDKVVCSLGSLVKSTPLGLVVAPNTSPPKSTFGQLPLLSIDHG